MSPVLKYLLIGAGIVLAIYLAQRFIPGGPSGPRSASDIPMGTPGPDAAAKEGKYPRAKELVSPSGWINTEPFTIADLVAQGKVVLVDFWTYSCINCQRTLPYLVDWYQKYRDQGLVIVGVHTPESDFEKDIANVRKAVEKYGIEYPVVLDNDYGTWQAYGNQYWPHKYLIDSDGFIVYDHIGEGGYAETEKKIQEVLAERLAKHGTGMPEPSITTPTGAVDVDFSKVRTPEMYLGAFRNTQYLGNAKGGTAGVQDLVLPAADGMQANLAYLGGKWEFTEQSVRCVSDCTLRLKYSAKQVNLVASSPSPASVTVLLDGAAAAPVTVRDASLYTLVEGDSYGEHVLELQLPAGIELFTFTFG